MLPFNDGVKLNLLGLLDRKLFLKGLDALGESGGAAGMEDGALIGLGPK